MITIEHKVSGRQIQFVPFRETSLDWMAMIGGQWQCFSKHDWCKVA